MRINSITSSWLDYPDNESLAIVVFLNGCEHNCFDCHNESLQKLDGGIEYTPYQALNKLMIEAERNNTRKLVLSGGDPLFKNSIEDVKEFLRINNFFDVCIYTGYDINYVKENRVAGFNFIKCGKYIASLRDSEAGKTNDVFVLASKNQKIYNSNFECISKENKFYFKQQEV